MDNQIRVYAAAPILTPDEHARLEAHEATIAAGLQTFVEVGNALLAIRDERLYRESHGTFEEYCLQRWVISRPSAYQAIGASQVIHNLSAFADTTGNTEIVLPTNEAQARPLVGLDPELQALVWEKVVATAPNGKVTAAHVTDVVRMLQTRNQGRPWAFQGTHNGEWYTPVDYIEAARQVLGEIDLDPASCDLAQQTVRARRYFTLADNGLQRPWQGRIWLNPPYRQPAIGQFVAKLCEEWQAGKVTAAILLTNPFTSDIWFHQAEALAARLCFTKARIHFTNPEGEKNTPTHGNCFFYFGLQPEIFTRIFRQFGFVR
jgi:hypothetical protein